MVKLNVTNQVGYQSTTVHINFVNSVTQEIIRSSIAQLQLQFLQFVGQLFPHLPLLFVPSFSSLQLGRWSGEASHLPFIDFMPSSYPSLFCNYLTWNYLFQHSIELCNPGGSYKISFLSSLPPDCVIQPLSAIFHKLGSKVVKDKGNFWLGSL